MKITENQLRRIIREEIIDLTKHPDFDVDQIGKYKIDGVGPGSIDLENVVTLDMTRLKERDFDDFEEASEAWEFMMYDLKDSPIIKNKLSNGAKYELALAFETEDRLDAWMGREFLVWPILESAGGSFRKFKLNDKDIRQIENDVKKLEKIGKKIVGKFKKRFAPKAKLK